VQQQGSKAKYIRELLDRSLELKLPAMSPEEFERTFGMKVSAQEIASISMAEVMVRQLVWKACTGNDKSIGETLDRLLGKAVQATEITTRSDSYHDFLIECRNADELEAGRPIKRVEARTDEQDIIADFLLVPSPRKFRRAKILISRGFTSGSKTISSITAAARLRSNPRSGRSNRLFSTPRRIIFTRGLRISASGSEKFAF
jgi:hypothetical protein